MEFFKAENIIKDYAGHRALDDVTVSVPRGSVYGLLGPNGAGKTTLIRIINQITAPDSGAVYFDGKPLKANDVYRIGYLPEERGLYKKMKVGEQAIYLARLKGLSKSDAQAKLKFWFDKFEISAWWNKKVEELSKGMQQKIQFIVTIIHEPELLIFDEPFSGFDPINANLLKEEILSLRDKGATIIFSTHNMSSVEEVCDHITLINNSKNILEGPIDEVRAKFNPDTYSLSLKGEVTNVQDLLGDDYSIVSSDIIKGVTKSVIKGVNSDSNSIIRKVVDTHQVLEFSEMAMSMNDIFIRAVEGNKNK